MLRTGISTAAIVQRLDAGELPADLAEDCELSDAEIEEAVLYERAACIMSTSRTATWESSFP